MDRLRILIFFVGCGILTLISLACPYVGPQYPVTYGSTPTPTPPPALAVTLIGTSTYTFSPASVTIAHGGSVTFVDATNYGLPHQLWVDNGSGICAANAPVPAGGTTVITAPFIAVGTYSYHCAIHSPCGTTSCSATCTGMVGTVLVQ